ncbi:MAG: TIGR00159 family protein [Anaerolineaceae bacterium]|nr:TIGR00159 family protein [Anaerolineaceae bacterium]
MTNFFNEIFFLIQRFGWADLLDIVLVSAIFYAVLILLRDTEALVLLRGALFIIIFLGLLTSLVDLPAFSWLISTVLPALVFAIPVIFAPEIRRALERVGRAGNVSFLNRSRSVSEQQIVETLDSVIQACTRLSERHHGALIILQRMQGLGEYVETGVTLNAKVTPELLLQIFYPNTPLHDGAVIIIDDQIVAASCVMPLSASGVLNKTPDRTMGLRHRAALGISEVSDAIAVVVSEETGSISIAHSGRMIRRLNMERLKNALYAFFQSTELTGEDGVLSRFLGFFKPKGQGPNEGGDL